MSILSINIDKIYGTVSAADVAALKGEMEQGNRMLQDGSGKGSDFLGWVNLPESITSEELKTIRKCADNLVSLADVILVIGIGGSYLGAKAVLEALSDPFQLLRNKQEKPIVLFAGQNLSEDYLYELLEGTRSYKIAAIVISKSGTTTEPAVAFRLIKNEIESRYGAEGAAKRIVAITDAARGALRTLATNEGYETFVIPDNIGGRYSVLTPVGLLPLAAAGINVDELVRGARDMEKATGTDVPFEKNPAMIYAAARTALYRAGKKIEILASYDPKLLYVAEWWKQLYGESEGKDGKGIFPASVTLTGCENPSVLQSDSLTHPACSPGCTNGANAVQGTCNNAAAFADHSPLRTSRHSVRLAKVISVRCSPVSRQSSTSGACSQRRPRRLRSG